MTPQDLHREMRLARAYERCHTSAALALPAPPSRPPRRAPTGQTALPSTGGATPSSAASASFPSRPFKRLMPVEMADRRKLGLCYNCDEPYVQGHKCLRLFYLEVTDYIVEEPESDEDEQTSDAGQDKPTISLSAIAGIRTEDTMQVYV